MFLNIVYRTLGVVIGIGFVVLGPFMLYFEGFGFLTVLQGIGIFFIAFVLLRFGLTGRNDIRILKSPRNER